MANMSIGERLAIVEHRRGDALTLSTPVTLLVGLPKSGKSSIALALALNAHRGEYWWSGTDPATETTGRPVAWMTCNGADVQRIVKLATKAVWGPAISLAIPLEGALDLRHPIHSRQLIAAVRHLGAGLAVCDAVELGHIDPSDPNTLLRFLADLNDVALETDRPVLAALSTEDVAGTLDRARRSAREIERIMGHAWN